MGFEMFKDEVDPEYHGREAAKNCSYNVTC